MKKNLLILLMLVVCTAMLASGQARKKRQAAGSTSAATAAMVVGHTYAKENVTIADPELAAAYDNGTFKLVIDVSIYFVTEDELQFTMTCDLVSRVYSAAEMESVKASMGLERMNDTQEEGYYVKKGVIYKKDGNFPVAAINKGGKSITLKDDLFKGNVLRMVE